MRVSLQFGVVGVINEVKKRALRDEALVFLIRLGLPAFRPWNEQ
jgi:hypothetical protein